MTAIHPCRLCPLREGCGQREVFRKLAAGSRAVSIRYRCSILSAEIRAGRRVVIQAPYVDNGYDYDGGGHETRSQNQEVPATIISARHDHSFSCVVDHGKLGTADEGIASDVSEPNRLRFRRTQKHHRIVRFLDQPDEPLCKICGNRQRDGLCDSRDGLTDYCARNAAEFEDFSQ